MPKTSAALSFFSMFVPVFIFCVMLAINCDLVAKPRLQKAISAEELCQQLDACTAIACSNMSADQVSAVYASQKFLGKAAQRFQAQLDKLTDMVSTQHAQASQDLAALTHERDNLLEVLQDRSSALQIEQIKAAVTAHFYGGLEASRKRQQQLKSEIDALSLKLVDFEIRIQKYIDEDFTATVWRQDTAAQMQALEFARFRLIFAIKNIKLIQALHSDAGLLLGNQEQRSEFFHVASSSTTNRVKYHQIYNEKSFLMGLLISANIPFSIDFQDSWYREYDNSNRSSLVYEEKIDFKAQFLPPKNAAKALIKFIFTLPGERRELLDRIAIAWRHNHLHRSIHDRDMAKVTIAVVGASLEVSFDPHEVGSTYAKTGPIWGVAATLWALDGQQGQLASYKGFSIESQDAIMRASKAVE